MHLAIIMTSKKEFSRFDARDIDISKYHSVNHYKKYSSVSHYKTERESFSKK